MRNEYEYINPDSVYTDPATGVLRNLGGITDRAALAFAETAATTKRARELKAAPIRVTDSASLFAIHRHLFQDIYEWAGKQRTVEISKGGKQFFSLSYFPNAIRFIDSLLAEYVGIGETDKVKLSRKLAEILDAVITCIRFAKGTGERNGSFCVCWHGKKAGRFR